MNQKRNLFFFTGAAGTGKSTTLEGLKKIYADLERPLYIQESITRVLYKQLGVENEITLQNQTEEEKVKFQFKLFDGYINYTIDKLNTIDSDAVIDRFAIDYIAWTLFVGPKLSREKYNQLIDMMNFFIDAIRLKYHININYFTFPCPWTTDTESSDGFRFDPFAKNTVIDAIIRSEVIKLFERINEKNLTEQPGIVLNIVETTCHGNSGKVVMAPEQRAAYIFAKKITPIGIVRTEDLIHHHV